MTVEKYNAALWVYLRVFSKMECIGKEKAKYKKISLHSS